MIGVSATANPGIKILVQSTEQYGGNSDVIVTVLRV